MRRELQADVLGVTCTIVVEKAESKWQAFGAYRGEPVTIKGAKSRKAAIDDWRQRAEELAKTLPPPERPSVLKLLSGFTVP